MKRFASLRTIASALAITLAAPAGASSPPEQIVDVATFSYADIVDMIDNSPNVAIAKISKAKQLKGDLAGDVPTGYARFLVEAKLSALLRGEQGLPARITYLADVPLNDSNRPPRLTRRQVIVAGVSVPGKPGFLRLAGTRGQMPWSPELETRVRAILAEIVAPDAPPRVTGVASAFHVKGTLPGESETQIFLKTRDDQPISLAILRRPGEETRWAVALGEMTDDSARPPQPETLLWYRLACFLPKALPGASLAGQEDSSAIAANLDYRFVIDSLGPCNRTPPRK